jgi:hypothetical protein
MGRDVLRLSDVLRDGTMSTMILGMTNELLFEGIENMARN